MSRELHESMMAARSTDIQLTERHLHDPVRCLPRAVWWISVLTGTSALLHRHICHRLETRLARLKLERRTLLALILQADRDAPD